VSLRSLSAASQAERPEAFRLRVKDLGQFLENMWCAEIEDAMDCVETQ
jgi:hypothetical protein